MRWCLDFVISMRLFQQVCQIQGIFQYYLSLIGNENFIYQPYSFWNFQALYIPPRFYLQLANFSELVTFLFHLFKCSKVQPVRIINILIENPLVQCHGSIRYSCLFFVFFFFAFVLLKAAVLPMFCCRLNRLLFFPQSPIPFCHLQQKVLCLLQQKVTGHKLGHIIV